MSGVSGTFETRSSARISFWIVDRSAMHRDEGGKSTNDPAGRSWSPGSRRASPSVPGEVRQVTRALPGSGCGPRVVRLASMAIAAGRKAGLRRIGANRVEEGEPPPPAPRIEPERRRESTPERRSGCRRRRRPGFPVVPRRSSSDRVIARARRAAGLHSNASDQRRPTSVLPMGGDEIEHARAHASDRDHEVARRGGAHRAPPR